MSEGNLESEAQLEPKSFVDRLAPGTVSFLVSFIAHVVLLIGLACWVVVQAAPSAGLVIDGYGAQAEADEVALDVLDASTVEPKGAELEPSNVSGNGNLDINIDAQLASTTLDGNRMLDSAMASIQGGAGGGGGRGGRGGGGAGALAEKLSKGAAFFGAYAEGERFVFILDSSRSMTGIRWMYACDELLASIEGLQSHQQFCVICFDVGPKCMFNLPLARAKFYKNDEATVKRLKYWLRTLQLGPATQPASSLVKALDMKPDAVFLLSDGELQDDTIPRLRQINGFSSERKQIPIHSIHLMSLQGRATLQMIALENAGTFTPITGMADMREPDEDETDMDGEDADPAKGDVAPMNKGKADAGKKDATKNVPDDKVADKPGAAPVVN
ncbi:MAG: hypothetical protein U0892_13040 [Pirellulales bacterium]